MSASLSALLWDLLLALFDRLWDLLLSPHYTIEFPSDEAVGGAASPLERLCPDKLHVRLAPLYGSAELTWQRLGVV